MDPSAHRLIFFGNERLATGVTTDVPVLRALLAAGYNIPAVVVAQNDMGPSRSARDLEIIALAEEHGMQILMPGNGADLAGQLTGFGAETGVLVAYGKLLPQSVIDLFPKGIVNLHPSLLPKHRGPTPIEHAILNAEAETGVSLMQLSAAMDSGDIYVQQVQVLEGNETKQELVDQLGLLGAHLLVEHLPAIIEGSMKPEPQDEQLATYDHRLEKGDGQLNFKLPASLLVRQVRAYAGWPRSRTQLKGIDVIITQAHSASGTGEVGNLCLDDHLLGIYTPDGVLMVDKLIPAGKSEMSATDFRNGYQL
ncbi:MAG TPA: methionyl-tRNA formyltransferase [Candidatus Saccharimonadales bacterium]|nr:methionyl-tRNA formyltransferase [Candidatus Saccharimonadales bacterium]